MKRRESREIAFALLFEWSFQATSLEEMVTNAAQARDLEIDGFALNLTGMAIEHMERIDALIEKYSEKWKINRISRVSLAVLRLSFCELSQFDDIPVGATINEAVELVKKYGAEDESAYVNGILGSYARKELGAAAKPGEELLESDQYPISSEPSGPPEPLAKPGETVGQPEPAPAAEGAPAQEREQTGGSADGGAGAE